VNSNLEFTVFLGDNVFIAGRQRADSRLVISNNVMAIEAYIRYSIVAGLR